ncbi:hypothetical protein H9P43_004444 [Blastocladiella emersonii ATCC 22665]|nr:hypothetical protein H9P43_004444 [Blastocladiella emersonii ATCC 22665]
MGIRAGTAGSRDVDTNGGGLDAADGAVDAEEARAKIPQPAKLHALSHYRPLIEMYASVDAQGSQSGEKEHSVTIKVAGRRTNCNSSTSWVSLRDGIDDIMVRVAYYCPDLMTEERRTEYAHVLLSRSPVPPPPFAAGEIYVSMSSRVGRGELTPKSLIELEGTADGNVHPAVRPLVARHGALAPRHDFNRCRVPPSEAFDSTSRITIYEQAEFTMISDVLIGHKIVQTAHVRLGEYHNREARDGLLFNTGSGTRRIGRLVQFVEYHHAGGPTRRAAVVERLEFVRRCPDTGIAVYARVSLVQKVTDPAHGHDIHDAETVEGVLNLIPSPHKTGEFLSNAYADAHSFMLLRNSDVCQSLNIPTN